MIVNLKVKNMFMVANINKKNMMLQIIRRQNWSIRVKIITSVTYRILFCVKCKSVVCF